MLSLKQELQKAEAAVEQLTAERDTAQSSMAKLQAKCAQLQEQVAKVLQCTRNSVRTNHCCEMPKPVPNVYRARIPVRRDTPRALHCLPIIGPAPIALWR